MNTVLNHAEEALMTNREDCNGCQSEREMGVMFCAFCGKKVNEEWTADFVQWCEKEDCRKEPVGFPRDMAIDMGRMSCRMCGRVVKIRTTDHMEDWGIESLNCD